MASVAPLLPGGAAADAHEQAAPAASNTVGARDDRPARTDALTLEQLCSYTRLWPEGRTPWWWFVLIAWAPIGVPLATARLLLLSCAGVVLSLVPSGAMADRVFGLGMRLLFPLLGMRMTVIGDAGAVARAKLVVANHISQLDAVPLRRVSPLSALMRETYMSFELIRRFAMKGFSPVVVPTPRVDGGEVERRAVREKVLARLRCSDRPLLVYPEGSITNGRYGCMRFSSFVFGLSLPVQPVAIRLWTPLPLEQDTVWDPLWKNLLFMLFQPCHCWQLNVLPLQAALEGEGADEFADRVARLVCSELGIVATAHTTQDKAAHLAAVRAVGKSCFLRNRQ